MVASSQARRRGVEFVDLLRQNGATIEPPKNTGGFPFLDSSQFLRADYRQEWLIESVLVKGQPMVVGGPKKTLKTSVVIDLAVSLASAKPFLNRFAVPKVLPVGIMSGESGGATLKETFRRVCSAKEIERPADLPVHWSFEVPSLADAEDLKHIAAAIRKHDLKVVIIDPLYLALLKGSTGLQASSLYDIGPLLADVAKACLDAGATPIIVHHFRKSSTYGGRESSYQPPELDDLAFSGIAEFARQWILLGRRRKFDPQMGDQHLWMSTGGSAGHSGVWGVDINEGRMQSNFTGRRWNVHVHTQTEQIACDQRVNEAEKLERTQRSDAVTLERIRNHLRREPNGLTVHSLVGIAAVGRPKLERLIDLLVDQSVVTRCPVPVQAGRSRREYDGVRLLVPDCDDDDERDLSSDASPEPSPPAPATEAELPQCEDSCHDSDDANE